MELILEVLGRILFFIIAMLVDGCFIDLFDGSLRRSPLWEGIGFFGASAWLIVSLGRIQWENTDWRAIFSGTVLLLGALTLIIWFGLSHYAVTMAT